jgi:hypothetical protein
VLVVEELGELRNALRVGLGLESEALGLEQGLQLLVVCDDAIVNDGELPCGVRSVGMAVHPRGRAVSRPPGVSDTGMAIEDLGEVGLGLLDELLELGDLANLLEREDLVLLVAINR